MVYITGIMKFHAIAYSWQGNEIVKLFGFQYSNAFVSNKLSVSYHHTYDYHMV